MNDLIQASVGDAMSWSNIEDAEVVKWPNMLNRRLAETAILTSARRGWPTLKGTGQLSQ